MFSSDNEKSIEEDKNSSNEIEILKFFRIYLWYFYSDVYNWKNLAYSIYHIEHLINHLDNYQIKDFIQKQFRILLDYFTLFMKDLITIQIQSSKRNETSLSSTSEINQIEQHIEKLKDHFINLKELILTTKKQFNLCKIDINAIDILLQAIEDIDFNSKIFNKQDQNKIDFLSLKEDLSKKSTKNDLIQMKIYIDNQIKQLIELNKENARELERIKLLKTSSCQARHIQSILSTNQSSHLKQIYSHQSSRPYITFELDHIRKYQQQAFIQSPYGTIPLYRRQAWAAANLFPNHSLPFLRYIQNSLRMQIHNLLGYDPSDICNNISKKKKQIKTFTKEILHPNNDILIMGNNNKLYHGRINSCEIISIKKSKENKIKIKTNIEDKIDIHFDQFDQSNQRIFDEHLFEYLDWQIQFNEQDLSNELCEELFHHWISIVCNDQSCNCKSNLTHIKSEDLSINANIYDDQCLCSQCSCNCEKYQDNQSICLCSQCSCKCLKTFSNENQSEISLNNEIHSTEQISIVKEIQENKRIDQSKEQMDFFQLPKENHINTICNSLELDDLTVVRQQILHQSSNMK